MYYVYSYIYILLYMDGDYEGNDNRRKLVG